MVMEELNRIKDLKQALINTGHEAIEDFLGYKTDVCDKAGLGMMIDDVLAQMPDEEFEKYYVKYVVTGNISASI